MSSTINTINAGGTFSTSTYIIAFSAGIILSSVISGYLGGLGDLRDLRGGSLSGSSGNTVEGFEGSESSIDSVNNVVSNNVTTMDDRLRVDKYKTEYKKTLSLSKDYLEGLQLSVLFDLKNIHVEKDDHEVVVKKCTDLAKKLTALHEGVKAIDSIQLP